MNACPICEVKPASPRRTMIVYDTQSKKNMHWQMPESMYQRIIKPVLLEREQRSKIAERQHAFWTNASIEYGVQAMDLYRQNNWQSTPLVQFYNRKSEHCSALSVQWYNEGEKLKRWSLTITRETPNDKPPYFKVKVTKYV